MKKVIHLENDELANAVAAGDTYIQIGNRKFMLFEIEDTDSSGFYEVMDPEEKQLLQEAMNEYNPPVSKDELLKQLSHVKRQ